MKKISLILAMLSSFSTIATKMNRMSLWRLKSWN